MDGYELKAIARRVGAELMAELRSGKIATIGGETVEAACDAATDGLNRRDRDTLIYLTCRRVVELAV